MKRDKRVFRVADNVVDEDERYPYVLIDETDTVIRLGQRISELVDEAFDRGADEVKHEENLIKAARR